MAIQTKIPSSFAAGTTVKYQRSYPAYSAAAGWNLTLYLAGKSVANVAAMPNGSAFDVTLSAASSGALEPGLYTWVERVNKAGELYDVAQGSVIVLPNLATATPGSMQSWAERALADVEAAIEDVAKGRITSYQIQGRAVKKVGPEDLPNLLKLRAYLQGIIRQQRTGKSTRTLHVEFPRTGSC